MTKLTAQGHTRTDGKSELVSPAVGYFRPALAPGALITAGAILGKLDHAVAS